VEELGESIAKESHHVVSVRVISGRIIMEVTGFRIGGQGDSDIIKERGELS
jgi:hypothetical protein